MTAKDLLKEVEAPVKPATKPDKKEHKPEKPGVNPWRKPKITPGEEPKPKANVACKYTDKMEQLAVEIVKKLITDDTFSVHKSNILKQLKEEKELTDEEKKMDFDELLIYRLNKEKEHNLPI